jgi:hypothetical protein
MKKRDLSRSIVGLALLLPLLLANLVPAPVAAAAFIDQAVEAYWSRADLPVAGRMTQRSWMWGPEPFAAVLETYAEGWLEEPVKQAFKPEQASQKRLVQYFDKSRMELTNPSTKNRGGITNGLLVVEMVSGRVQLGNSRHAAGYSPAEIAVAGDPAGVNPNAPTYASFRGVATLDGVANRAANRVGQGVSATLGRNGQVGENGSLAGAATIAHFDENFGHNIPNVFWEFMNQTGPVFIVERHKTGDKANQPVVKPEGGLAGAVQEETVVNWIEAMGFPISEPYWASVRVGGQDRTVLIQAFQRRVLTYTPSNDPAFQVEMGNVGRHYHEWRYAPMPLNAAVASAMTFSNSAPVLRYQVMQPPILPGKTFPGGPTGAETMTAEGTFVVLQLQLTNISQGPQKLGRDLIVQATTPDGARSVRVADGPTDSYNKKVVGPRPSRCPKTGCVQPPRVWDTIEPGKALTLYVVYDVPATFTGLRLVPAIEDAPAIVLR